MARAIAVRPRAAAPVLLGAGPFKGMRDSLDPSSARRDYATLLQNVYARDPERGTAVIGRPGFAQLGSQVNSGVRVQRFYQFTKLDGTEISFFVAGGEIYTINWGARTHSRVVTTANLTTAVVTLSTTARVFCVTFADKVVISDGVNKPFAWDGTSGAGGITPITGAATGGWYGQPVVHYGKLMGIRAAERSTFEWSEEGQINTGYETGGYLNVWTLGQTDQEPLFALIPTNEQLGVLRGRSATAITGAVTEEFASTGTREALSDSIGTESPASVVYANGRVHFVDADLRPHVWIPGGGIVPAWEDFSETITGLDRDYIANAISLYDPATRLVLHGLTETGQTVTGALLGIQTKHLTAQCIWRGFIFTTVDVLKNANGKPIIVHGTADGYVYDHGLPFGEATEMVWSDGFQSGTRPILHIVESPHLGYDEMQEKFFPRLDMSFRVPNDLTDLRISTITPHVEASPLDFDLTGGLAQWDVAVWDSAEWSENVAEQHKAVGLLAYGRWIRWRLQHEGIGEQFGFIRGSVTAHIRGAFPASP
jgi:hypothetical protein